MSAPAAISTLPCPEPDPNFDAIVQHWAQARIDVPIEVIARLDEAGKQLVTVGAALQGLYIALFATNLFKGQVYGKSVMLMSTSLGLVMIFAALAVCAVQVKFDVFRTFELFQHGRITPADEKLMHEVRDWCCRVRNAVKYKRLLLAIAKTCLCLNFLASFWVLYELMWR